MNTTERLIRLGLMELVDHPTHRPGKVARLTAAGLAQLDRDTFIRRTTSLTFAARLLLLEVREGDKSYAELCANLGISERNARRMAAELEAGGWLQRRMESGRALLALARPGKLVAG